jgi:hypothetical protein
MTNVRTFALAALAGGVLIGGVFAVRPSQDDAKQTPPVVTDRPYADQLRLVHAQPFVLEQPYTHEYRSERPLVASGWIVVLETDADRLFLRQTHNPVLMGGAQTLERVNHGNQSGRLVALLPAPIDASGEVSLDLHDVPLWFAWDEAVPEDEKLLPEQMDAQILRRELAKAKRLGARPRPEAEVDAALAAGGGTIYVLDRVELQPFLADLLDVHSPQETELIGSLRMPVLGR